MNVGFVGLGDMGGPMVANLCKAGFPVVAYDIRASALDGARAAGADVAESVEDLAKQADVVLICVRTDDQVTDVVLGTAGLLGAARPGQTFVVHSTVQPDTMHRLAAAAAAVGVDVVDAPVSGANMAAKAATLTIIVGGDTVVLERCRPVFEAVGSRIFHAGPVGSAQVVKIANNIMLHGNHALALEALKLIGHYGLDERTFFDVVKVSTGRSWVIENWDYMDHIIGEHTLAGTPEMYDLMSKELWNATVVARRQHVELPLTALAAAVTEGHVKEREVVLASREPKTGHRSEEGARNA